MLCSFPTCELSIPGCQSHCHNVLSMSMSLSLCPPWVPGYPGTSVSIPGTCSSGTGYFHSGSPPPHGKSEMIGNSMHSEISCLSHICIPMYDHTLLIMMMPIMQVCKRYARVLDFDPFFRSILWQVTVARTGISSESYWCSPDFSILLWLSRADCTAPS
jgi:hypothetical protein